MVFVEVTEIQNHGGNEASLEDTQQSAAGQKRSAARKPELACCNDGPENHLCGDPAVGTNPFGHELGGKLCAEEGEFEDGEAEVVVCVGC